MKRTTLSDMTAKQQVITEPAGKSPWIHAWADQVAGIDTFS